MLSQSDAPASGEHTFSVTLWNAATGGEPIWSDELTTQITRGVFDLALGANKPLPKLGDATWISVAIDGGPPAARSRLTTVPYAMTSSALATDYVSSISVNGERLNARAQDVKIVTGNGIGATIDPATSSIMLTLDKSVVKKGAATQSISTNSGVAWGEQGNSAPWTNGTSTYIPFIGTTDTTSYFEIHIQDGGSRPDHSIVAHLKSYGSGSPNIIFGYGAGSPTGNYVDQTYGATISGGGDYTVQNLIGDGTGQGAYGTIGGGYDNRISADWGTISGGWRNTIGNVSATIGGGYRNIAGASSTGSHGYETVGGGLENWALEDDATVAGGEFNHATAGESTIGGGSANIASGTQSFVGGGVGNVASGTGSFVGGGGTKPFADGGMYYGLNNTAEGDFSTIGGGTHNHARGNNSFMGGGDTNSIMPNANYSVVDGGYLNTVDTNAPYSSITAGTSNLNQGNRAAIVAGDSNSILYTHADYRSGRNCFIGAGAHNVIDGHGEGETREYDYAINTAIVAGSHNTAHEGNNLIGAGTYNELMDEESFIGAGQRNTILESLDAIAAGMQNTDSGEAEFIGAGQQNKLNGENAAIVAGFQNHASGDASFIGAGRNGEAVGNYNAVVGGTNNKILPLPGGAIITKSFIGGGGSNVIRASNAGIAGGMSNKIDVRSDNGFIGGGLTNVIDTSMPYSGIASGRFNLISPLGSDVPGHSSFIGGGENNTVLGSGFNSPNDSLVASAIVAGAQNIVHERFSIIGAGQLDTAMDDWNFIGAGRMNATAGGIANSIVGGSGNRIRNFGTQGGGGAFIGGGDSNFINGGAAMAAIPAGDHLEADFYAQTVIGAYNIKSNAFGVGGPTQGTDLTASNSTNDGALFTVGNGHSGATRSNAFTVSYDGHATVTENLAGGSTTIQGTTYGNNTIVAWGNVPPGATGAVGPGMTDGIGAKVVHGTPGSGIYTITLFVNDPNGSPHTFAVGDAAIVVTPRQILDGVASIVTVEPITAAGTFQVKTWSSFTAATDDAGFQFHVVVR